VRLITASSPLARFWRCASRCNPRCNPRSNPRPGLPSRLCVPSQTNSALLANTLALDKLNEHDGVEVRRCGWGTRRRLRFRASSLRRSPGRRRASQPLPSGVPDGPRLSACPAPQSLKVIYSEDPAALHAISELLLLQEQARSFGSLAVNYSHVLAEAAQSGQMFGVSMRRCSRVVALRADLAAWCVGVAAEACTEARPASRDVLARPQNAACCPHRQLTPCAGRRGGVR
jgi:hypothetical protein